MYVNTFTSPNYKRRIHSGLGPGKLTRVTIHPLVSIIFISDSSFVECVVAGGGEVSSFIG